MKSILLCKILKNEQLASNIYKIEMERVAGLEDIKPGQFLNIKCGEEEAPLLRRPISISYVEKDRIGIVVMKAGKGTELLCSRKVGQFLDVLGPLGNGFTIDEGAKKSVVVGGGIGTAPLLEVVKNLKKDVTVLLGYRTETYLVDEFKKYAQRVIVATEDGSVGHKGYVTEPLKEILENQGADMIYTCGPEVMLKEVKKIADEYKVGCQLSIEERMACGVGACLVCACKVKAEEKGVKFVRTCKDGPVFYKEEVIFDE